MAKGEWVVVHQVNFKMFQLILWRRSIWILNKIFTENSFKSKLKNIEEFENIHGILGKVLNEYDLMKVTWKFLDLRCEKYWKLNNYCHSKFNSNTKKWFWKEIQFTLGPTTHTTLMFRKAPLIYFFLYFGYPPWS